MLFAEVPNFGTSGCVAYILWVLGLKKRLGGNLLGN